MVVASLLSGLLSSRVTWAQVPAPTEPAPAPTLQLQLSPPLTTARPSPAQWEAWRASMSRAPMPKKGCFKATYPNTEWQEVPCATPPLHPYPPARGRLPDTVGNGNDFAAQVSSGSISEAVGSFDSVAGVTSESGYVGGVPREVANSFSLQLNANTFTTSACSGAANPSACQGWQQFVFNNSSCIYNSGYVPCAYMQYWLIGYDTTCPTGWYTYVISSETDCYQSSSAPQVPVQTIADLGQLSLTGNAASGGMDTLVLETASDMYSTQNEDSVLNLAEGWRAAEFNVFGDCCSDEANFNSGSTIVVRTSVDNGTTNAPSCVEEGFTGETNNLTLVDSCSTIGGASPAITFEETTPTSVPAALLVTPSIGNFGNVKLRKQKVIKLDLKNLASTGGPSITISGASVTDFPVFGFINSKSTCSTGTVLAPKKKCVLAMGFQPSATGFQTDTLTIDDDADNAPQQIPLQGTGK